MAFQQFSVHFDIQATTSAPRLVRQRFSQRTAPVGFSQFSVHFVPASATDWYVDGSVNAPYLRNFHSFCTFCICLRNNTGTSKVQSMNLTCGMSTVFCTIKNASTCRCITTGRPPQRKWEHVCQDRHTRGGHVVRLEHDPLKGTSKELP